MIAALLFACSSAPREVAIPSPRPLVIGHRGAPGYLPDHTLEGYTRAVDLGADFIEPDLVSTRDGQLVARHENELGHTTDVAVKFPDRRTTRVVDGESVTGWFTEDFTLAEIKTLRAVQPWPSRPHEFDGLYTVPTFEEVLVLREQLAERSGREIGVYPETKHPSYHDSIGLPLDKLLAEALRRHDLDRADAPVFIQSFELANLEELAKTSKARRILLIGEPGETPAGEARTYGALLADLPALSKVVAGIGVHKSMLYGPSGPTDWVERAHAAGLLVHVYTFRAEADQLGPAADGDVRTELRRFYELGVDGVFADYPDIAHQVREGL